MLKTPVNIGFLCRVPQLGWFPNKHSHPASKSQLPLFPQQLGAGFHSPTRAVKRRLRTGRAGGRLRGADILPVAQGWKLPVMKGLLARTRKLSRRQGRVVALVAKGLKNREIATKLGIGAHVARNYVSAIYDKIGVSNRVELALWYEARIHEGRLVL